MMVKLVSLISPVLPAGHVDRPARQPRIVRARLVHGNGEVQDIVIRNVSQTGIGATARGPSPVRGQRIRVVLPGEQEVKGMVRWFSGQAFGTQLDAELDLEALGMALQRQAHVVQVSGEWKVEDRHRVYTQYTDPSRIRRV